MIKTDIPCPECNFRGHLLKDETTMKGICDTCNTKFIFTGPTQFHYAPPEYPEAKPRKNGARKRYKTTPEELTRLRQLCILLRKK